MILFLTSSPTGDLDGSFVPEGMDWRNGFDEVLRRDWPQNARCLMITATPEEYGKNDEMSDFFRAALARSQLSCARFDLLDLRRGLISQEKLCGYQVIFLGGGHVPTQNAYFHWLGLPEKLAHFDGIIIGISAGTMNCAHTVYAQPELEGETRVPHEQRFLRGLGLTDLNILPHWQLVQHWTLDGLRMLEDITLPDSKGHRFLALPDGSFVREAQGRREVYGAHLIIENGTILSMHNA